MTQPMTGPVRLKLIASGWEAPRLIAQGRTIHLGSGPEAEVKIAGEGVAALHYLIEWEGDRPFLISCADREDRRQLVDGDEITLGEHARVRIRLLGDEVRKPGSPHLCRQCHRTLSSEEASGGGRYRVDDLILCRPCVWSGYGAFPLVSGLRLVHQLGVGMSGKVYEAHDWKSGRRLAIKLLPNLLTSRPSARARYRFERLKREMALSAGLHHPHILRTYRIGQEAGQLFVVMEYVHGSDWHRALMMRGWPYDPEEIQTQLGELGSALDYAHHEGIIHRDVKPANILVNDRGFVKVTDFGLARELHEPSHLTRTGTVLGTIPFSSPEQLRDPRQVGPHSDVYSVAATVYCLLTGHPPFQHNNHFKLLQMIRDEMPPPLAEKRPELPRHLDEALTLALSKEPARRPKTVSALIDTLYPV